MSHATQNKDRERDHLPEKKKEKMRGKKRHRVNKFDTDMFAISIFVRIWQWNLEP